VRNAIRFTASGRPVEVELASDGERATLRVRDHGPGVPADALNEIWKPFYRVEGDRARNSGGTGLGLAITEQAVTLHGGRVHAQNHDGGGLLVTLELPLSPNVEKAPNAKNPIWPGSPRPSPTRSGGAANPAGVRA
jgi:signal transduction histidine kinase